MSQHSLPGVAFAPVWDPLEKEWQQEVVKAAHLLGYTVAHFRPAMTKHGMRTAVAADGAGFPDLELVGRGRIIHRELKRNNGRVSVDQAAWGERINANGGDWAVWRPRDLESIVLPNLGATVVS